MGEFTAFIPSDVWWLPLFIFCARVTDVSVGTVRIIMVTRGRRSVAVVLAFFEIVVWIGAISTVLTHLDSWINVLSFAGGFAVGNAVGMAIERRLAMGTQTLFFVSQGPHHAVAERLRFNDLQATALNGHGRYGPVAMCLSVVPRRMTPAVIAMARAVDPDVHVVVEDVHHSTMLQAHAMLPGKVPFGLGALNTSAFMNHNGQVAH